MISRSAFLKVFLGSFFIQASWSFEKMQGLGFASAISPALKELYNDKKPRLEALKRHLAFYNAHPYMASPLLGASINLEEKAEKGEAQGAQVQKFKSMIMGSYGAIGDSFFWGSVRPMASVVGVLSTFLWGWKGPLVFLLVYNLFHLWMRWHGLKEGLVLGKDVVGYIMSLDLPEWGLRFKRVSAAVLGVVTVVALGSLFGVAGPPVRKWLWLGAGLPAVIAAVLVLSLLFKRGLSVSKLIFIITLPLILYGLLLRY
ncbi:MAG: PTS system mannose/fructose/sorbose family transporter subunit IID [Deltaproteobacteria bacterium]|nr:PTS system mannose/fructose/sorbose family transporter subunit IID [Deltaproteobacteria bacterium]